MKRNYIILLAALLTVACAGNGDIMSPTPQEGEILFSGINCRSQSPDLL